MNKNKKPKIVSFDIETAPTKAYVWRRWKENITLDQVISEGYVLCAVAKFLDEKTPRKVALTDFANEFKRNSENDRKVVEWCWNILDEADIVIAHYGKGFDIPVLNSRFLAYDMPPPSPYKIVDTKEVASKKFKFPYNSLNGLSKYLGIGKKLDTDFNLWVDCMNGVKKAWSKMVNYCVHDVILLEKLYLKLLPWIENHPNLALYNLNDTKPSCCKCGSYKIAWRGYHRTTTQIYHSYQCNECGGWGRERTSCLSKDKKQSINTNVVV
jgi:DNA polymerase III epsilon subunit-like protein